MPNHSLLPTPHSPSYAQLTVTDTGQGIRAELLPYVFDRFRQGDSSTTKNSQGLGLGLSIARQIVELHGGTVRAESPGEGQGTTMMVRLPLQSLPVDVTLPDELEPTAVEPLAVDRQALPSLAGLYILVVDDEVDSLDLTQWTLEDAGATVVAVTSARDAIAALIESPDRYDVLLADIEMPGEDGFSLIRQVRSLDAAAGGQTPAAAITAYVTERERQEAIKAGFQRHIAKPIDLAQLVWTVAHLAGRAIDE